MNKSAVLVFVRIRVMLHHPLLYSVALIQSGQSSKVSKKDYWVRNISNTTTKAFKRPLIQSN